jgi:uncharacterized SAM-binding protein YcdF (DUF218 family)
MRVSISKSLGTLANPATILGLSILVHALATMVGLNWLAALCSIVSVAIVVLLPAASWIAVPLEARFPANPDLPDRVAGIVVLGGMERPAQSLAWGEPSLGDAGPIRALVALWRRYPDARLVFSGGGPNKRMSEATVARDFLREIGADDRMVAYEDRSRNTLENARLTHALIRPKPDESWILVCQAAGMPRAIGVFRKAGWKVIAYPAGYLTKGKTPRLSFDVLESLNLASVALHEWLGLFVYRALGYTDEVFPS